MTIAARMVRMVRNANLIITAWDGGSVGWYLARHLLTSVMRLIFRDLAVRESHQRQGIGKELIRRTQKASEPGDNYFVGCAGRRAILSAYRIYSPSTGVEVASPESLSLEVAIVVKV